MVRSIRGIRALAALVLVGGLIVAPAALAQGLPEVTIEQPRDGIDVATLGIPLTDIPLAVSYKSSAGVDKIEVLVDGAVQFVDRFSAPETEGRRSYLWDATAHGPGKHTISVIVFAGARSAGAQAMVEYKAVPSPGEVQPGPTLAVVSPSPGAVVSGLVPLRVEATGARPHWVQFFLDGRAVGHSLSEPYVISVDTSLYADGRHVVYAAMKTDRGTVTSDTLHVNFMNLEIPEPQGEEIVEPPVEDPRIEGPGPEVDVAPVEDPVEPDPGPAIAIPAEPIEPLTPPTPPPADPLNVGVDPQGQPPLEVVEPAVPEVPIVETVEPVEADPGPGAMTDLPPGLAGAEEWQPVGGGEEGPAVVLPVEVAPDEPPLPVEPVVEPPTPAEATIRPLEMELAGPDQLDVEVPSAPPAEPSVPTVAELVPPVEEPAVPPLEPVEPDAPLLPEPQGPTAEEVTPPPPLTPQLVEIDEAPTGPLSPLPPLVPLPSLTGPADAALPDPPPTGPAAPATEEAPSPEESPAPAQSEQPVEPLPAAAEELAGPAEVAAPGALPEPTTPEEIAVAEVPTEAIEPAPPAPAEPPAAAEAVAVDPLPTFGDDPVPVSGDTPLLTSPTGGPAPAAATTASGLVVWRDGAPMEGVRPAILQDGAVYLALRDLLIAVRGSMTWDAPSGHMSGRAGTAAFAITAGDDTATLRRGRIALDAPARVIDDALMVPLGFVKELLGLQAVQDPAAGTLELTGSSQ